jgi:hypothetical protein
MHFMPKTPPPRISCRVQDNYEKYGRARQAVDGVSEHGSKIYAVCMLGHLTKIQILNHDV